MAKLWSLWNEANFLQLKRRYQNPSCESNLDELRLFLNSVIMQNNFCYLHLEKQTQFRLEKKTLNEAKNLLCLFNDGVRYKSIYFKSSLLLKLSRFFATMRQTQTKA